MSHDEHGPEDNPRLEEALGKGIESRPRNWLVPVSLALLRQSSSYGYELMERAVELGFEAMNPGTLYRALRNMEKDGLCASKWDTASAGPARRVYSVTPAGEAYLQLWVQSLRQYQRTMDSFLQTYRAVSQTYKPYKPRGE
jgi:PadR family transcriptional regulator PadR